MQKQQNAISIEIRRFMYTTYNHENSQHWHKIGWKMYIQVFLIITNIIKTYIQRWINQSVY